MLCYLLFLLLLLLLCTIACKLSLDLLFSAKWMQLCAISTEMLYYFFVFDELCVDEGDECCWFSVIVFIIKFWFLRYLSFSFKDSVFTDWFVVACWPCKSSIIFFFHHLQFFSNEKFQSFQLCIQLYNSLNLQISNHDCYYQSSFWSVRLG